MVDPLCEVGTVGAIEAVVARLLAQHELHLCHLVVEVVVVVVEMLLVEVENDAYVGGAVYVFQLVAGEFGHHQCVGVELVGDVKQGDADVACKDYLAAFAVGVV